MTIRITSVPLRGGDATLLIGNITIDPISSPRFDDFNNDNLLTADDLDLLSDAVRQNPLDLTFDVNGDSVVGGFDHVTWIRRIKHTTLAAVIATGLLAIAVWRRRLGPR
jgi:hypothetical protein